MVPYTCPDQNKIILIMIEACVLVVFYFILWVSHRKLKKMTKKQIECLLKDEITLKDQLVTDEMREWYEKN